MVFRFVLLGPWPLAVIPHRPRDAGQLPAHPWGPLPTGTTVKWTLIFCLDSEREFSCGLLYCNWVRLGCLNFILYFSQPITKEKYLRVSIYTLLLPLREPKSYKDSKWVYRIPNTLESAPPYPSPPATKPYVYLSFTFHFALYFLLSRFCRIT